MPKPPRINLSYSNVIATIALFVALGGGAYAAGVLPSNSVGTAQLKKNSVTEKKLKNGAVTNAKVKKGSLLADRFKSGQLPAGPKGETGPQGPAGQAGTAGTTGPRGPSDAYSDATAAQIQISDPGTLVGSLSLPPGNWVIFGKVSAFNNTGTFATGDCRLFAGATQIDIAFFDLQSSSGSNLNDLPISLQATRTLPAITGIQMMCQDLAGSDVRVADRHLTAIQVETLTNQ